MKSKEKSLVLSVTIGSILEWYEIYLYVYWTPIISNTFFELTEPLAELTNAIFVFIVGFGARPLGGVLFGYFGDKFGRKNVFLISIVAMSIPCFLTALMPSIGAWNIFTITYIGLMRFLQGIPAGGELPGAMCLLSESTSPQRKRYLCSYALVGPQIGQILSMLQCLLLEIYLPNEFLVQWGWRLSFFIGGIIGLFGYYLRKKLHESQSFKHLKEHHQILNNPLKETVKYYKKNILVGFLISIFEVVGFFLIAFFLVENFTKLFEFTPIQSLLINICLLTPLVILQPIVGKIGDKFKNKPLYILSAIGIILFAFPFYLTITYEVKFWSLVCLCILVLLFSIQFGLLPSLLVDLFPTRVRFTCLGFSFNVCDSVIGGLTPIVATLLVQLTGNRAAFVVMYPICALIFLLSLKFVKADKKQMSIYS